MSSRSNMDENSKGSDDSKPSHSGAVTTTQKFIAETIGTFFLVFAGCGAAVVDKKYDGLITFPGVSMTWGLIVVVLVYSIGHISGAHCNPAVSISFTAFKFFPVDQLFFYLIAQMLGSTLASATLLYVFEPGPQHFFGTVPLGSVWQSFVLEFIISSFLIFVVFAVATDSHAQGELAGLAAGCTIHLNVFLAGPVSGGSMNPARTLGPAIVMQNYTAIWVYIVAPILGGLTGGFMYGLIRFPDKAAKEVSKQVKKASKTAAKSLDK